MDNTRLYGRTGPPHAELVKPAVDPVPHLGQPLRVAPASVVHGRDAIELPALGDTAFLRTWVNRGTGRWLPPNHDEPPQPGEDDEQRQSKQGNSQPVRHRDKIRDLLDQHARADQRLAPTVADRLGALATRRANEAKPGQWRPTRHGGADTERDQEKAADHNHQAGGQPHRVRVTHAHTAIIQPTSSRKSVRHKDGRSVAARDGWARQASNLRSLACQLCALRPAVHIRF